MLDGTNMYLEGTKGDFGSAKVQAFIEARLTKPDAAVTKAKKLAPSLDKVQMIEVGGVLATERDALAPVSTNDKTVYIASVPAADDLTQRDLPKYPYFVLPAGPVRSRIMRSGNTPAIRASRRSSPSALTTPSVMSRSADFRRPSRIAAARSCRKSGRRSAPRTSGRTSRPSKPTRMPFSP